MKEVQVRSLSGEVVLLDNQTLDGLRACIRGQIVAPGDSNYDEVREIWNAMIDRRPALIVRCSGTADVLQAIRFARRHQLLISVRGGGIILPASRSRTAHF